MEREVIASKMKWNPYWIGTGISIFLVAVVATICVVFSRTGAVSGPNIFLIVLVAILALGVFAWNVRNAIVQRKLPDDLIVYENGKLIVFTPKGRAEISLKEVERADLYAEKRDRIWFFRQRSDSIYSRNRIEIALKSGKTLRVEGVEQPQEAVKRIAVLQALRERDDSSGSGL